jgi:hypothetical protein
MGTDNYQLASAPESEDDRTRWLEHAAGFILFEDMRRYASAQIDPNVSPEARAQIEKGIDDAVYGLMMIMDGVTGILSNETEEVAIQFTARLVRRDDEGNGKLLAEADLNRTDGMCGSFHGWKEGDFGEAPVCQGE